MGRLVSIVAATVVCLAGCASASPTGAPAPAPASARPTATASAPASASPSAVAVDRDQRWRDGLAEIVPGLERLHPDPFHSTSKAQLEAAVDALAADVPSLDDDEVLAGILRIAALVSADGLDAHTSVYPWGEGTYPLTSMPLRLWVFADGVHVVDALPAHQDLVGAEVTSIGGVPIDEAVAALDPLIPRDNDSTVSLLLPRFLLIPQLLHGAGVIDDPAAVELGLIDAGGTRTTAQIAPIPMADYNTWAGPYGLHLPNDPRVRYLSLAEEPLWFEDAAPGTVYVQYNRVDGPRFRDLQDLRARLEQDDVTSVIVDIRHNYGGEVRAIEPVLDALDAAPDDAHRWLITGRNTFSAASLFAARYTADETVTVAGEPMGGGPSAWGNPRPVSLGETGLILDVSTLYEVGSDPDDLRLTIEPDVPIELTVEDILAGRDPVLDTVLGADR